MATIAPAPKKAITRLGIIKLVIGILLSAAFIYALLARIPLLEIGRAFSHARSEWLLAALGGIALSYGLRLSRWMLMLRSFGSAVSPTRALVPFMGAVALNNVLPFRAGDVIRIAMGERYTGVPASGQIGSLVLERLFDIVMLLVLLFLVSLLPTLPLNDPVLRRMLQVIPPLAAIAVISFIAAPIPIRTVVRRLDDRFPRLAPAGRALLRLSNSITILSRPSLLAGALVISFVAWLAEGSAYYMVGRALGLHVPPSSALLALSIGTLATMIPSAPGYVGTFHFFAARAIRAGGETATGAAAFAILIHGMLWLATTSAGLLLMALSNARGRKLPRVTVS
jgi:glycosyltransferase 2 family protein